MVPCVPGGSSGRSCSGDVPRGLVRVAGDNSHGERETSVWIIPSEKRNDGGARGVAGRGETVWGEASNTPGKGWSASGPRGVGVGSLWLASFLSFVPLLSG